MKELISFIVKNLVEHADRVEVREVAGDRTQVYEVTVAPSDQGKLIGKNGRTIRSVRSLVNVAASRQGKRAMVEVID
jgi:predicted RNA-binding protein YlqC (UPF0109 family)